MSAKQLDQVAQATKTAAIKIRQQKKGALRSPFFD